jgi:hypothetical protein
MQSVAGRATIGDQDAADILAYLIDYMTQSAATSSPSEEDEGDDLDW